MPAAKIRSPMKTEARSALEPRCHAERALLVPWITPAAATARATPPRAHPLAGANRTRSTAVHSASAAKIARGAIRTAADLNRDGATGSPP